MIKKITLMFALLVISFGYSQSLPFDFSDSAQLMIGQEGTVGTIIDDGGNDVLQVVGGTSDWDHVGITFAQRLDLSDPANNTITFRIKATTDLGPRNHLLKFEGGANGGGATTEVAFSTAAGTAWQDITLDFDSGNNGPPGDYGSMIIFTDAQNPPVPGATGTYLIDDIAGGTNLAASPIFSLPVDFSDLFNDEMIGADGAVVNIITDPDDAGNNVLEIVGNGQQWDNAQATFATPIDLSDNNNNVIKFDFKAITGDGMGTHAVKFEGGTTADTQVEFNTTDNEWHSYELDFPGGLGTYTKIVIFTDFGVVGPTGTYYIDNIEQTSAPCESPELSPTVIDFSDPEDGQFNGGDGATVSITATPELQIIGTGGDWDNAQVTFCDPVDLSDNDNNTLRFKMKSTTAGDGEVRQHGVSFQPVNGVSEINFNTTGQDWTDVELDFPAGLGSYPSMIIFVDVPVFGVGGTNTETGTYLIDDISLDATVLSVEDFTAAEFKVFPNPSSDKWNVKSNSTVESLVLYNILGKQVITLSPNSNEVIIDGSSLNPGMYFAQIKGANGTKTVKLIKE